MSATPARRGKVLGDWTKTISFLAGFALVAVVAAAEEPCADCHEDSIEATVHEGFECVDCHPEAADEDAHPADSVQVSCESCHDDIIDDLASSIHAAALDPSTDPGSAPHGASGCVACHGEIHVLASADQPTSPIHPGNTAETCGQCHSQPRAARQLGLHLVLPIEAYSRSVHARALAAGLDAPTCQTCHGSHSITGGWVPSSPVNRSRVPETCGQCHSEISEAFEKSIHGRAAAKGIRDSPVCTDCHGEHQILSPDREDSPVYASNVPKMTCGRCHGDLRMNQKLGLASDKVSAFDASFHGLASRAGAVTVANCASCHGVHDILPSSDPDSHVHPRNLSETCGQCHPGIGDQISVGSVHVFDTERDHFAVFVIRRIYVWLIVVTIGLMVLHNLLDFSRKIQHPPDRRPIAGPRQLRMRTGFRIAHAMLASSFVVLAYTGFALVSPEAWWARPLQSWESELGLRGLIHRLAAVVMVGSGFYHGAHLLIRRRARACLAGMRPGYEDWHELKERVRWFLGRRSTPPRAPWIDYGEKMEYYAVVWGSLVMTITGFFLWFENIALRWLPKLALDIATVIHFWEAVLACLAIVVWHFYAVIFDPAVYPVDPAFLTGHSAPGRERLREGPDRGDDEHEPAVKP